MFLCHPRNSGQVKRMNRELKTMVGKLCAKTHLKWPDIPPIALFYLHTRLREDLHKSSYEILFGHAPLQAKTCKTVYAPLIGGDCQIASYLSVLKQRLRELQDMGVLIQSGSLDYSLQNFQPGDMVYVKNFANTLTTDQNWVGP